MGKWDEYKVGDPAAQAAPDAGPTPGKWDQYKIPAASAAPAPAPLSDEEMMRAYIQAQKDQQAGLADSSVRKVYSRHGVIRDLLKQEALAQSPDLQAEARRLAEHASNLMEDNPPRPNRSIGETLLSIANTGPRMTGAFVQEAFDRSRLEEKQKHPDWSDEQVNREVGQRGILSNVLSQFRRPHPIKGALEATTDLDRPGLPEVLAELASRYPIPGPKQLDMAALERPPTERLSVPETLARFGKGELYPMKQERMTPDDAAQRGLLASFTPVGDPLAPLQAKVLGPVLSAGGKVAGKVVGAGVEALENVPKIGPTVQKVTRFVEGPTANARQALNALKKAEVPEGVARPSPALTPEQFNENFIRMRAAKVQNLQKVEEAGKTIAGLGLSPAENETVHQALATGDVSGLSPRAKKAFDTFNELRQTHGADARQFFGLPLRENYIPLMAKEEPALEYRQLMHEIPPDGVQAPVGRTNAPPPLGGHFKKAELMDSLSAEAGQPIRTPGEVNRYISENPQSPIASSVRKNFGLKPGETAFEEDLGKLAVRRFSKSAIENPVGKFAQDNLSQMAVHVPVGTKAPKGFRAVSELGSGVLSKAMGPDAFIPEQVWKLFEPAAKTNPGLIDKMLSAWRRAVTVASGPGYHVRNMTTSAHVLAGEYGPLQAALLGMEGQAAVAGHDFPILARGGKVYSAQEVRQEMANLGLAKGTGGSPYQTALDARAGVGLPTPGTTPLLGQRGAVTRKLGAAAQGADETARMAVVIGELRRGATLKDAIKKGSELITHTGNLTPLEETLAKYMPFINWTKRAAPVQLKQAILGKSGTAPKIQSFMNANVPNDTKAPAGLVPARVRDAAGYPMGRKDEMGNPIYGYDISAPQMAVSNIMDPAYQLLTGRGREAAASLQDKVQSQVAPPIALSAQVLANQTFRGKPLGDLEPASPMALAAAKVLPLEKAGLAFRGGPPGAEEVKVPAYVNVAAQTLPYSQWVRILQARTPEERHDRILQAIGIGRTPVKVESERYGRLKNEVLGPAEKLKQKVRATQTD